MSTGNILIDALAVAIDKRVAGIGHYLDKRFLQSKSFTNTSQRDMLSKAICYAHYSKFISGKA